MILRHADDLYSMYGHLADEVPVAAGQTVERGELLGTVLARSDGRAPSHLHVELRTFLTLPEVNGDTPRYAYGCGFRCPPGPGYWPIDAPEHPSALGWRNPTHVLSRRLYGGDQPAAGAAVIVADTSGATAIWSAPPGAHGARQLSAIELAVGERFDLLAIDAGPEATEGTSAEDYRLWYQIALPAGTRAWVQGAIPSTGETGSDGRLSSIRFPFVPTTPVPTESAASALYR